MPHAHSESTFEHFLSCDPHVGSRSRTSGRADYVRRVVEIDSVNTAPPATSEAMRLWARTHSVTRSLWVVSSICGVYPGWAKRVATPELSARSRTLIRSTLAAQNTSVDGQRVAPRRSRCSRRNLPECDRCRRAGARPRRGSPSIPSPLALVTATFGEVHMRRHAPFTDRKAPVGLGPEHVEPDRHPHRDLSTKVDVGGCI